MASVLFRLQAKSGQCANPEHPDGAGLAVPSTRDFVVGQSLDVPQDEDVAVVGREAVEDPGQGELAVRLRGLPAGGGVRGGKEVAEPLGNGGEILVEGDFALEITLLGADVAADFVGECARQDASQPRHEFAFAGALKLGEIADRVNQGLLDDVGRIELRLEPALDLGSRDATEPGFESAKEFVRGGQRTGVDGGDAVMEGRRPGVHGELAC